jgi:hypothetical protein
MTMVGMLDANAVIPLVCLVLECDYPLLNQIVIGLLRPAGQPIALPIVAVTADDHGGSRRAG